MPLGGSLLDLGSTLTGVQAVENLVEVTMCAFNHLREVMGNTASDGLAGGAGRAGEDNQSQRSNQRCRQEVGPSVSHRFYSLSFLFLRRA
jgi:hypothetical protein